MTKSNSTRSRMKRARHLPAMHIDEGGEEYIVYVLVPGMERKDFSVEIKDHLLTVSAARQEALHCYGGENTNRQTWKECFDLPFDADALLTAAEYRNGELQIHIPKREKAVAGAFGKVHVY